MLVTRSPYRDFDLHRRRPSVPSLSNATAVICCESAMRMREATRALPLCGPNCTSRMRGSGFFSANR
jgi:hypothetical protein